MTRQFPTHTRTHTVDDNSTHNKRRGGGLQNASKSFERSGPFVGTRALLNASSRVAGGHVRRPRSLKKQPREEAQFERGFCCCLPACAVHCFSGEEEGGPFVALETRGLCFSHKRPASVERRRRRHLLKTEVGAPEALVLDDVFLTRFVVFSLLAAFFFSAPFCKVFARWWNGVKCFFFVSF